MMISQRQEEILNNIIREYIDSAKPVSSRLLEKKHRFGIKPATIRIEMQKLTDQGFLAQPHTSAGRIPTDKGYRFFVDKLMATEISNFKKAFFNNQEDSLGFIQEVTKFLADHTGGLALGYVSSEKLLLKEGWNDIFLEPEFEETGLASKFAQMIEDFEANIEDVFADLSYLPHVYIGKENPFSSAKDFSLIAAKCHFPKEDAVLTIVGPKRMPYDKNIGLIESIIKLLEK
jgi:transcriptional regulator of heat shock response